MSNNTNKNPSRSYQETLDLLFNMMPDFQQVGAEAYKPGLERIKEFNRHLGSPAGGFLSIHIAGTNGKGSVSHMLTSVLMSAGYRVGLYTSPHLKDFRERIRINGEVISEWDVVEFTERNLDKIKELDLSFFETTVGMAFEHFAREEVDVAVIETGLGGRLDATNIVNPLISVITNIGYDHISFLGDSEESIAREKAGIIKPNVPVLIGQQSDVTERIFRDTAKQNNSSIRFAGDRFKVVRVEDAILKNGVTRRVFRVRRPLSIFSSRYELDLIGDYQQYNVVTALSAIELLNQKSSLSIGRRAIKSGLRIASESTGLKGRWQILGHSPLLVADTAHNADGIVQIVKQIKSQTYEKLYIVFGVANDKDLSSILSLMPTEAYYIFTRAEGKRALASQTLAEEAKYYHLRGEIIDSVAEAVDRAKVLAGEEDMIYVGGSSYVVAELDI